MTISDTCRSFGPETVRDVLLSEALAQRRVELRLMDIIADNLSNIGRYAKSLLEKLGRSAESQHDDCARFNAHAGTTRDELPALLGMAAAALTKVVSRKSLRLHIWIPPWRPRGRNDLEATIARRRDLHLPINARRWADDALRPGELIAEWLRTAPAHGRRLAFDIRRACSAILGRRLATRLSQRDVCRRNGEQCCNS
jgi:hypothetical protein